MPTGGAAWARGAMVDRAAREKDDFYPTPPEATAALLGVERFDGPIWEPACGDGAMARVLEQAGHRVLATDLVCRGYGTPRVDFLQEWRLLAPNVVTNPPFKMADEFARHAWALGARKLVLLARLNWLAGKKRQAMFRETGLSRVWVHSARLTMHRSGEAPEKPTGSMIDFAWFVWDRDAGPTRTFDWL